MTSLPRDPLTGTDRLLIDGMNLLHAMSTTPEPMPQAALIGKLRAFVPAAIGIELVLDGVPDRGMRGERVASGLIVRHSGRRTADELLLSLVDETRAAVGPQGTAGLLVVTDDRVLRSALHDRGARTAGSAWLIGRLQRPKLSSPSVGNRRPPRGSGSARPSTGGSAGGHGGHGSHGGHAGSIDGDERAGWTPGRGATTKKGNPRRGRPPSGRMPA